ncbi:hypothetical protein Tco_1166514 [Tanacetum coccineum]
MVEILKEHPIRPLLTNSTIVQTIYIQQFCHTVSYNRATDVMSFKVDQQEVDVNLKVLCIVLQLFQANAEKPFIPASNFEGITNFLRQLNYDESKTPFTNISTFEKKFVPQSWQMLLTIINRCTTSKATGLDISRLCTLQMLCRVVYNHHIDYTTLVWDDLIVHVEGIGKKGNTNIPFVRHMKLMIEYFMLKHQWITKRTHAESYTPEMDEPIHKINKSNATTDNAGMVIPNALLTRHVVMME